MKALLITNNPNENNQAHMVKIKQIKCVAAGEETARRGCEHESCVDCAESQMAHIRDCSPLSG